MSINVASARERPAHAALERLERGERRARDGDHGHVALCHVHAHPVVVVGPERAALAAVAPTRIEHEVVHEELAPALEQVAEGLCALGTLEDVVLVDPDPGQLAPIAASSKLPKCWLAFATLAVSAGTSSAAVTASGCTNTGGSEIVSLDASSATLPGTVATCSASWPSDIDFACGFHPRWACGTRSSTRRVA